MPCYELALASWIQTCLVTSSLLLRGYEHALLRGLLTSLLLLRVDVHALLRARSCFVDTYMPCYELDVASWIQTCLVTSSLLLRGYEHAYT